MIPSLHPLSVKRENEQKVLPTKKSPLPSVSPHQEKEKPKEKLEELLTICKKNIAKKCLEEKMHWEEETFTTEEEPEEAPLAEVPIPLSPLLSSSSFSSQSPVSCSVSLSPTVLNFFDTLSAHMLVMSIDNEESTTLFFQGEEGSPFAGAKIVFQEFSTAPKIFNVTIHACEEAALLIQAHAAAFLELLQDRKFSFGINRMETALLQEEESFDNQDEQEEHHS